MQSLATFKTERANRYLTSLCQHFARKIDAECDADTGWVQFPFGRCDMNASDKRLELRASAADAKHLGMVVKIMTSHLERYAFREHPVLDWNVLPE